MTEYSVLNFSITVLLQMYHFFRISCFWKTDVVNKSLTLFIHCPKYTISAFGSTEKQARCQQHQTKRQFLPPEHTDFTAG